jgi:hypothetical protein
VEHLTEREVERLIEAAKANRHGHRCSDARLAFSRARRIEVLEEMQEQSSTFVARADEVIE